MNAYTLTEDQERLRRTVADVARKRVATRAAEAALEYMRPHVAQLRQTEDHKEGLRALAERREPRFQGR